MTYGPPNQGGYHPAPQQQGYPQPAPPSGIGAKLTGTSSNGQPLFFVGIVLAVLGLLVVIFSCLTWLSVTQSIELGEGSESVKISSEGTVSGLGATDGGEPEFSGPAADEFREMVEASGEFESDTNDVDTTKAGIWTLVFGAFALVAGVVLIARRYQGVAAIGATVFGLASAITAIVFTASSGSGVVDSKEIDDLRKEGDELVEMGFATSADVSPSTGYGLWIVLIASILLLVAGAFALVLAITAKPGVPVVSAPYGGGAPGAPLFGQQNPPQRYQAPGAPQPGGGQTQVNPFSGASGVPPQQSAPQQSAPQPGQPAQWGQTQYNQYPDQGSGQQ